MKLGGHLAESELGGDQRSEPEIGDQKSGGWSLEVGVTVEPQRRKGREGRPFIESGWPIR